MTQTQQPGAVPVLDRNRKCAKCGGAAVGLKFVPSPETLQSAGMDPTEEIQRRTRLGLAINGELIQRNCQECGYFWVERPLDAASAPEAS